MANTPLTLPQPQQKVFRESPSQDDTMMRQDNIFNTTWYNFFLDLKNRVGGEAPSGVITDAFIDDTAPADGSILIGNLASAKYFKSNYVIPVSHTTGDITYADSATVVQSLPIGSSNEVLTVVAGKPSWEPIPAIPTELEDAMAFTYFMGG